MSLEAVLTTILSLSILVQVVVIYYIVRFFELKFNRRVNSWIVLTPLVVAGSHIILALVSPATGTAGGILNRLLIVVQVIYWPVFLFYLYVLYRILREAA